MRGAPGQLRAPPAGSTLHTNLLCALASAELVYVYLIFQAGADEGRARAPFKEAARARISANRLLALVARLARGQHLAGFVRPASSVLQEEPAKIDYEPAGS